MNWLFYVGGGSVVLLSWWLLVAFILAKTFSVDKATKITIPIWYLVPPLLLWIGVCLRWVR